MILSSLSRTELNHSKLNISPKKVSEVSKLHKKDSHFGVSEKEVENY